MIFFFFFLAQNRLNNSQEISDLRIPASNRLSKDLKIPQTRISEIIKGKRRMTRVTALRLSK